MLCLCSCCLYSTAHCRIFFLALWCSLTNLSLDSGFQPSAIRIPAIWIPDFNRLDTGFKPSEFRIPTIWIPDSNCLDSGFQPSGFWILDSNHLDSGFQPSGFRIPTVWILDSNRPDPWIPNSNIFDFIHVSCTSRYYLNLFSPT